MPAHALREPHTINARELEADWELPHVWGGEGGRLGTEPTPLADVRAIADQLRTGATTNPIRVDRATGRIVNGLRRLAAYRLAFGDDCEIPVRWIDMNATPGAEWFALPCERSDPVPALREEADAS